MISFILKILIRLYRATLSPILAALGAECRFYPSCSHYASHCLEKDHLSLAIGKISRRLLKCGPWHPGGVDLP